MEPKFPFPEFPTRFTNRLCLRDIQYSDVADFFAIRSNAENMRFIPRPVAQTTQDIINHINICREGYLKGDAINFAIALRETDQFIGSIGFYRTQWDADRTEIGYILSPEHRGKGYVQEAVQELIRFAFDEIGFHSLEAVIDPRNTSSINVIERAGFVKEGHLKESGFWNGEYIDSLIYSLINKN